MDEILKERYLLACERVCELNGDENSFFAALAGRCSFLVKCNDLAVSGKLSELGLPELSSLNKEAYTELARDYETSFANPAYAEKTVGKKVGKLLSALYSYAFRYIPAAFSGDTEVLTIYMELVLEIYSQYVQDGFNSAAIGNAIYFFHHDYCHELMLRKQKLARDPNCNIPLKLLNENDISKPDYLYKTGLYVSDNETGTHEFINSLSDEEINSIALTFAGGYERGFYAAGIDYSERKIVELRYPLGYERIIKRAIEIFEEQGKSFVMYFDPASGAGVVSTSPNRQFDYDHRNDNVLYLDGRYKEVYLSALTEAYKSLASELTVYAGPACLESFGEADFDPVNRPECLSPDSEQTALLVSMKNEGARILRQYLDMTKRSFTIMALPCSEIGADFKEIFSEIIKVNTLDNDLYKKIQQSIIDLLDAGSFVHVKGKGDNKTDIKVVLHKLVNRVKETNFENCTADVNIPVGEVFTSPVLTGTSGILNVSNAYLEGTEFKNLTLHFKDGMVEDYSCDNFETEEENRRCIFENILFRHETLPIGEFAIGTNTTAYAVAGKFGIWKKLPILIAEKTGPHFAVGDTCYSDMEEVRVFNPDGKEIVAKSNEISDLRDTDRNKAYFHCHTDITIPYDELDFIRVYNEKGEAVSIIENGLFAVPGTEELNAKILCS